MAKLDNYPLKQFLGVSNIGEPSELARNLLIRASNVDITKDAKVYRRTGRTKVVSGSFHSLFSDGKTCLAVSKGNLFRINNDYTFSSIRWNVGDNRMSYATINEKIYYTNETVIGFVKDGIDVTLPEPDKIFREKIFPGKLIEYYRGRLYIAKGNTIWYTDPLAYHQIDMRKNFVQLPSECIMLRAVNDGIYVSDQKYTYFLLGKGPKDFTLTGRLFDYPAIYGTDLAMDDQAFRNIINRHNSTPKFDYRGRIAMWVGTKGICLGLNEGRASCITDNKYTLPAAKEGASLVRLDEIKQFISSLGFGNETSETIISQVN